MKPLIARFALPLAILLGGCATFWDATLPALARTAGLASEWAVKKYPEHRIAFVTAEASLTLYLSEETLTMDRLINILSAAGLDETGWAGPDGDLYLQAGLIVWQLASGVNHVIANNKYVVMFGGEIRDGFRRGLATPPITANRGVTLYAVPYLPRTHLGKRVVH